MRCAPGEGGGAVIEHYVKIGAWMHAFLVCGRRKLERDIHVQYFSTYVWEKTESQMRSLDFTTVICALTQCPILLFVYCCCFCCPCDPVPKFFPIFIYCHTYVDSSFYLAGPRFKIIWDFVCSTFFWQYLRLKSKYFMLYPHLHGFSIHLINSYCFDLNYFCTKVHVFPL